MSDEENTSVRKRNPKAQNESEVSEKITRASGDESTKDNKILESKSEQNQSVDEQKQAATSADDKFDKQKDETNTPVSLRGTYWLTRIVIVRYMGFIYFVAYLVSLHQNKPLIGKNGLLPGNLYLSDIRSHLGATSSNWYLMSNTPTLLWFVDFEQDLDYWLDIIAWAGLGISAFMMVTGAGNWPLLLFQWLLYHSLVNVGQRWFSFGWESQLLETGFLTVFLCPLLSLSSVPRDTPPSKINIFTYRWLIFRIMLGAGLIKVRGDKCWRDLTCMNYHYETQPVPNPMSYFMHQSPEFFHKFEVLSNHFVELIAPVFLLLTRSWCMIGGAVQILFQVILIISGNLSFLNWLTILPSLACFDDACYAWLFSNSPNGVKAKVMDIQREKLKPGKRQKLGAVLRKTFNISFGLLIGYLSISVVQNLLSSRQAMNTSFDPFRLVNTYGAFGSVTKKRTEVIFQGTNSSDPQSPSAVWEEFQFKCKPGDITRRPCVISPYHYRLDWLMWFAAFQNYQHNSWLLHLAAKFLVNDNNTESLIAQNPFHGRSPPRYVRAEHYRYRFCTVGSAEAKKGQWWRRKKIGSYLPPVSLDMLQGIIMSQRWPVPRTISKI